MNVSDMLCFDADVMIVECHERHWPNCSLSLNDTAATCIRSYRSANKSLSSLSCTRRYKSRPFVSRPFQ